jgi:predicted aspartyl protease
MLGRWGAAALALAVMTGPALAADNGAKCKPLQGIASVDMTLDGHRLYVPVTIAGQHRRMILDTGAFLTSVTPETVTELNLAKSHVMLRLEDVLGNYSEEMATLPTFQLGLLHAENLKVFILTRTKAPVSTVQAPSDPTQEFAGIYGSDFLRNYDVDLDFGLRKVHLVSQDHCDGDGVYWGPAGYTVLPMTLTDSGGIILRMKLDGAEMRVLLDTGAGLSVLTSAAATRFFGLSAGSDAKSQVINNERVEGVFTHRFASLELNGLAIHNVDITVLPDVASARQDAKDSRPWFYKTSTTDYDLIMGINELSRLHVYIAYKERSIYVSGADDRYVPPATQTPAH